ncbi:MAG: MBL fold metallo-hydrolase, partial [candidate division Zixibacteria bacterium]
LEVNILFSRAGIAQQITIGDNASFVLVDTGDGTLRDLRLNKINCRNLAGILFTHGHFDHMGGLHTLLGYLRMIGRKENLPILIPMGCVEAIGVVENFKEVYSDSIPFQIELKEVNSPQAYNIAGVNILPFDVYHCGSIAGGSVLDRIPALGYRISSNGESVAITGDTGDCVKLRELVTGVDLAIIEATYEKSSDVTKEELEKVHLSEDLAAEIGALAKEYILVHKGRR